MDLFKKIYAEYKIGIELITFCKSISMAVFQRCINAYFYDSIHYLAVLLNTKQFLSTKTPFPAKTGLNHFYYNPILKNINAN